MRTKEKFYQWLKWLAGGVVASLLAGSAYAQGTSTFPKASGAPATRSEMKPHVGVLAGVAQPEGSFDAAGEVAIDVGYQPMIPFGLGAEISRFEANAREGADIERTAIMVKGSYNMGGTIPVIRDSYVGLGLGPVFTETETQFQAAPLVGFDIPLNRGATAQYFSLGANAKYALISGSDSDALSVAGAVKYWF